MVGKPMPCAPNPLPGRSSGALWERIRGETMNDTEKDRLIEIMRQNIAEKEKYLYELLRENIKLKAQAAPKPKEGRP